MDNTTMEQNFTDITRTINMSRSSMFLALNSLEAREMLDTLSDKLSQKVTKEDILQQFGVENMSSDDNVIVGHIRKYFNDGEVPVTSDFTITVEQYADDYAVASVTVSDSENADTTVYLSNGVWL